MTNNHWPSVDSHLQNGTGSVSLSSLPIKAAYTSLMTVCNRSPLRLTMMHGQTSLMIRWCSFWEWGRECVTFSCDYQCGLYLIYEYLHSIATQITQDSRPTIIDTVLTLIFKTGQGVCLSVFWLYSLSITQKTTITYWSQWLAMNSWKSECDHW